MKNPVKAYNNKEFLNSPDARTIRILAEYLEPVQRFRQQTIRDTIVFFGSARIPAPEKTQKDVPPTDIEQKLSRYYEDAVKLSSLLTTWSIDLCRQRNQNGQQFYICSGGGPGIMEAANRGAHEAGGQSIGLNISIPFEQESNPFVTEDLSFEFHYFFIRKFWFVYLAKALVIFPGGFGTIDEMMELLTLTQTGKINKPMPVVLYGTDYWKSVINFDELLKWGMISPEDLDLFRFFDDPDEAFRHLQKEVEYLLEVE